MKSFGSQLRGTFDRVRARQIPDPQCGAALRAVMNRLKGEILWSQLRGTFDRVRAWQIPDPQCGAALRAVMN